MNLIFGNVASTIYDISMPHGSIQLLLGLETCLHHLLLLLTSYFRQVQKSLIVLWSCRIGGGQNAKDLSVFPQYADHGKPFEHFGTVRRLPKALCQITSSMVKNLMAPIPP